MSKYLVYNNENEIVTGFGPDTTMGLQTVGEGFVDYVISFDQSNKIDTYVCEGSTINAGRRSTDEIISDLINEYTDVWKSLA